MRFDRKTTIPNLLRATPVFAGCGVVAACFLAACGAEQPVSPSFVARTWSLQVGGGQEAQPAERPRTLLSFGDRGLVEVRSGRNDRVGEWPLVVDGQTSFSLPSAPETLEEILEEGLRVAAVTYCAFLNQAGVPREEDVAVVDEAVASLLSVLETPLREVTPTEEELARVSKDAGAALLKDVLRELEIPESEEAVLDAQGNQGFWFIGDLKSIANQNLDPRFPDTSGFRELVDLLPSLAWVHGDAGTRQTLSACGSMLYLDAPQELLHNELRQLEHQCHNSDVSGASSQYCLLELFEDSFAVEVQLDSPNTRDAPFARWGIEPTVQFNP